MSIREVMISTVDNPFNPFDNFEAWRMFDIEKEHFSCERLARIINLSPDMSEHEEDVERERAIDEIIKYDPEDKFIKVVREVEK